jgi:uncharacterized LabA/DUF88 family protein
MTIRLFGRRASSKKVIDTDAADATPTRRRRTATPKPEAPPPKASAAPAPEKTATGRTRRGRRGGARRNKKPAAETAATNAPAAPPAKAEAAPIVPLRPRRDGVEGLFEEIAERQLAALQSVQGTLSAIENRLVSMERIAAPAERPRVGIFVDVPNVMYAAERLRLKMDFKKVLEFLLRHRELVRASAYAPISDDPQARLETQKFVQPFVDLGYRVVTKPLKRFADGSMKANFDVELAIDVITMSDRLDIVTLVSGDGDFRRLVELVQSKGVRVEVVAFGQSTAAELRAVADEYIDLHDHLATLRA